MLPLRVKHLVVALCNDLGVDSVSRQIILDRFYSEGLGFLTKTLPQLSKAVLSALEHGIFNDTNVPSTCFTAVRFGKWSRVPNFLGLRTIFRRSGVLRKGAAAADILRIRQVCEYFYKLALNFRDTDLKRSEQRYIETEKTMESIDPPGPLMDRLRKRVETYYGLDTPVDTILARNRPRFTPGAFSGSTAVKALHGVDWYDYKTSKIATYTVPAAFYNYRWAAKPYPAVKRRWDNHFFRSSLSRVCEVLFVPKDSRGPRVISKEPASLVRFQMSFHDWITDTLERVTHNRINFRDQRINQELAREASVTKEWSTFDLKDASDRVSYKVISNLFRYLPSGKFIRDCRSTHAVLPSGRTLKLNKLSGMGSGLTFPSMALLIHCVCSDAISRHFRIPFKRAMRLVYVYGDDLIVPTLSSGLIQKALTDVGLMVNKDKSFCRGSFRESCGGDYFKGQSVGPVRLKLSSAGVRVFRATSLNFINRDFAILNLERHCRELIKAGLHCTADVIYSWIEKVLGTSLPYVTGSDSYLGRYTPDGLGILTDHPKDKFIPVPVSFRRSTSPFRAYQLNMLGSTLRRSNCDAVTSSDPLTLIESGIRPDPIGLAVPRQIRLIKQK